MSLIADIFKFIVQYRIHMAVLAGLTTLMPFLATAEGLTPEVLSVGLAMAMLTLSIHLMNKLADLQQDTLDPRTLPVAPHNIRWVLKVAQAMFVLPIAWLFLNPPVLVVYIICGGVMGYLVNYGFNWGGKRHRLKNVFLLKNIVPALYYALCISLPYAIMAADGIVTVFIVHGISAFVFILLNEILGDFRDVSADKTAGIKTIPNTIGLWGAKIFGVVLMVAFVGWIFMTVPVSPSLLPVYVIMATIFLCANTTRPWWYYQLMIGLWVVIMATQVFITIGHA